MTWRMRVVLGPYDSEMRQFEAITSNTASYTWLKRFDPDHPPPHGTIEFTDDPAEAMRFATFEDLFECWRRPSTSAPLRPDGKPNRPLTAFSMQPVGDDET